MFYERGETKEVKPEEAIATFKSSQRFALKFFPIRLKDISTKTIEKLIVGVLNAKVSSTWIAP